MNVYNFIARDNYGEYLGIATLRGDYLPSHLNICMAVLGEYCDAATYSMIGTDGKELEICPVNPEHYLSNEFRQILSQCNRSWLYARIEYTGGFRKGEQGKIVGFTSNRSDGCLFLVCWDRGAYSHVGSYDLSMIKVVSQ